MSPFPSGAPPRCVRVEPRSALIRGVLGEVWEYRELLYFLAWRDVKVRYKQTALGVAWAVIQPALMMLVFTVIFGRIAALDAGDAPYPLVVLGGLVPWLFFSNALTASAASLINSSQLVTKVYFPRVLVPSASVFGCALDFVIGVGLLIGALLAFRIAPSWRLLALAPLMLLTCVLAVACGIGLAAVIVRFRDVRHALPFVIQIGLFASPVIYPVSSFPERWRWILHLNPMTGIVEGFRSALFQQPFDLDSMGVAVFGACLLFLCSVAVFARLERDFADVI